MVLTIVKAATPAWAAKSRMMIAVVGTTTAIATTRVVDVVTTIPTTV